MSEERWDRSRGARWFAAWTRLLAGHRVGLAVGLVVMGGVFSYLSRGVVWQADVLQFFSANSADVRNVREAAGRPGLATQLRVDVHGVKGAGDEVVRAAAVELAERLRGGPKGASIFYQVWTGPGMMEMATGYERLMEQAPMLLTDEQQKEIEGRANSESINQRFAEVRNRLADPDGEIFLRRLAGDPLGLADLVTGKLAAISPVDSGMETGTRGGNRGRGGVTMENGLLETRDSAGGLHTMLVLEPKSLPSDQKDAAFTMTAVGLAIDTVAEEHKGSEMWVVGAHRAYVENASQVTEDVTKVSVIGTAAVAVAIGIYFRKGKRLGKGEILICMIPPGVGVGVALGIAGIFHVQLPLLLLGFAGLLCGSTTDYGIQIIAECRRLAVGRAGVGGGGWDEELAARAAWGMFFPISMSVATSVTGFAALGLSESPGLRALGLFVAGATVCIWGVTFLVLPAFLGPWLLATREKAAMRKPWRGFWWVGGVAFFLGTLWLGRAAVGVRFNADPKALDGSSARLLADEQAFYRVWGDMRNRAVVLVQGKSAEEVLAMLGKVVGYLEDQKRDGLVSGVISPAEILPDSETVKARAAGWEKYWTEDRRAKLRVMLSAAASANGLKPEAFAGYADRVGSVPVMTAEERIDASPAGLFPGLIQRDDGGYSVATIVEMNPVGRGAGEESLRLATGWAPELRLLFPDAGGAASARVSILSGNLLAFDATEHARAEGERLGPWCMLAILLPLWIYFRRLRRAWLVMVCLVVGLVWVLGAAAVFGGGLNLLSLVPVLFTLGVAVDYGIYAATDPAWRVGGERFAVAVGEGHLSLARGDGLVGERLGAGAYATGSAGGGGGDGHSSPARGEGLLLGSSMGLAYATGSALDGNRLGATFVCAMTTILGSGSLILAGHPAMRWLGITLVAGLVGGYLTSFYVVAPMTRWRYRRAARAMERRGWGGWRRVVAGVGRIGLGLGLAGLTILLAVPPVVEIILGREKPVGVEGAIRAHPAVEEPRARVYTAGDSWMRWRDGGRENGLWEILLSGDAQNRGYATAKFSSPIDVRIENEMLEQLDYFLPQEWSRYLVLRGMGANMVDLASYVPVEYQQEIYWASQFYDDPHRYLAPTYPRILSYHALHDISQMLIDNPLIVPNSFACTGVVSLPSYSAGAGGAGGEGHLMLARNFDFEGGDSFGRQKSVTYVVPPAGEGIPFVHVAWPGLSGVVTGMNRERIALFINAAATKDFRRIGTPTILMAREVLENARSIDEAEAIIRRTQVFVSDIVTVADGKTGKARIFEKSPGATAAYDVVDSAVVANHLVTPTFADDPVNKERRDEGTTTQRYARARQLLDRMEHQVTPEALAGFLRDKMGVDDKPLGLGNRNAIDGLIACHAVIMDATAGKMWVATWPNAEGEFVGIDVMAMLDHGVGQAGYGEDKEDAGNFAPTSLPEDSMMAAGTGQERSAWELVLAGRLAAKSAEDALAAGSADVALPLADAVIRDNPDFYLGHELRGRALFMRGDAAGAKLELTEAMKRDPPYAQRRTAIEGLLRKCDTRIK